MERNKFFIDNFLKNKIYLTSIVFENLHKIQVEDLFLHNNVVTVDKNTIQCDCNEFYSKNKICKHIYFVLNGIVYSPFKFESVTTDVFNDKNPKYNYNEKCIIDRTNNHEDDNCCICHEEYNNELCTQCRTCKNIFHKNCIKYWLRLCVRCECPLCRNYWRTIEDYS